jgi:CRISPR-associated protein Cas2
MWLIVMFDLPVDTKEARRNYALFRKSLLADGFMRMQYSVYARYCFSDEQAQVHVGRVQMNLPPDGEVRIIQITDKQYERMRIFFGKMRHNAPKQPEQLSFF